MLLIQGGTVYTGGRLVKADVLLDDGIILNVGQGIDTPGAQVFSAEGMVVAPGFIDLHVHLREPGLSHKETVKTGTRAAAAGGFTTICAMPNVNPVPDCMAALEQQLEIIRRDAQVQVLPYGAITKGEAGQAVADIEKMAPWCAGFSDDGKGVQSGEMMRESMKRIAAVGGLLAAHCEEEALVPKGGCIHQGEAAGRLGLTGIPSESEWKPIQRDLELVRETGVRYHVCHISAKESVALVRKAKREGLPVTCEATPHQIMLWDGEIAADDGWYKMNPPIRSREDRDAIVEGLCDGTIDCIATDHAPHTIEEKSRGFSKSAFGVVGLETAFAVCHTALVKTGRMTLAQLLYKLTDAPGRLLGRQQVLAAGAAADIAVLDVNALWRVEPEAFFSMGRATPFAGRELTGRVVATFYKGRQIFNKTGFSRG